MNSNLNFKSDNMDSFLLLIFQLAATLLMASTFSTSTLRNAAQIWRHGAWKPPQRGNAPKLGDLGGMESSGDIPNSKTRYSC